MGNEQYVRMLSAVEYTISQLQRGPKDRGDKESARTYEHRVEIWYKHKVRFVLFAIKCIKPTDEHRANEYLQELRRLKDSL